jgi:4-amino-4-deoxy-L-arabinose transferase-like glycosyltransferase
VLIRIHKRKLFLRQQYLFLFIPLILSAYAHLWNPVGFPDLFYDEGVYVRRALHVLEGQGPEESGTYFDHPHFGQIFLASMFKIIGYPDSLNPKPGDVHSVEMLYLVPRVLMGLLAVADTFLVYKIADRLYGRKVAFIASIFFAVMPMTWMLRRVLLDSILLPLLLTSILFALHRIAGKYPTDVVAGLRGIKLSKNILVLLSGIFLGLAIFTKIPVFMMIPLVAYLIYKNSNLIDKKGKLKTLGLWFIPVILIPAIWPIYAITSDQFDDWKAGVFNQAARNNDGLARVMGYFFKYDPLLLIGGAIGLVYAAIRKDVFALIWIMPFILFLYFLNYGTYFYVIPLLPAFCIAAARLLFDTPGWIQRKIPISLIWNIIGSVVKTERLFRVVLTKRIGRNINKEIQPTITSYTIEGNGNDNEIKGGQNQAQKKIDSARERTITAHMFRNASWVGFTYASILIIVMVAGIGIASTTLLVITNASWAQLQAAAYAITYMEERKADNLTLVSSPVYSWISYYIFDHYQALKSFTNVPQGEVRYDNVLLLADNHMRTTMKKENRENLWSLYNDTTLLTQYRGKLADYDTRDYPYTNLLNMKEGAFVEIKGGSDIMMGQEDNNLRSNMRIQNSQESKSFVENEDNLLMHIHTKLNVSKDGQPLVVPANIGIDPLLHKDNSLDIYGPQKSPLHTHTDTGTVHVESKIITNYTLGEFLDVWGMDLGSKAIKATIDGRVVPNPRGHVLSDGENIDLVICSKINTIDSNVC